VLAANRSYYDAFESRDIDAMSDVWEHSDDVVCTHPGWVTLRGWSEVAGAFYALFNNAQRVQFVLTEAHCVVRGNVAWVVVDENILGEQSGATVSALNVFTYAGARQWNLVAHQASLVSPPMADED
jgi:ketosteroid isomerase-like protein